MIIRPYENKDLDQCEAIARGFQETSLFDVSGWDSDKFNYLASQAGKPDSDVFSWVADLDGVIIGAFVGYITEYYFSKGKLAQDLIVIFLPEHRKYAYKGIERMLSEFEAWAKNKGAVEVCIGSSTGLKTDNYKNFLIDQGYQDVGFLTKKRI
tara:strand:+ start:7351 stop:7809 length:459 start_codon:yes stop_codon:yes gene_type:complete